MQLARHDAYHVQLMLKCEIKIKTKRNNHVCPFYCNVGRELFVAEFCEHCGKLMKRWDATHCSEECLLRSIKDSRSLNDGGQKSHA